MHQGYRVTRTSRRHCGAEGRRNRSMYPQGMPFPSGRVTQSTELQRFVHCTDDYSAHRSDNCEEAGPVILSALRAPCNTQ